jgi:hypothetical protein
VYHRERIWFSSTLSCIKEKEEITKTPRGLSPLPTKQQGRSLPQRGAPFLSKGRALFIKGALSTSYLHLSTSPYFNQTFPHLPAPSADSSSPPPPPYQGHRGTTHSSPKSRQKEHTWGHDGLGVRPLASVWTVGDYPGRHTEVRIKQDFTSVPESSWLRRKLHRKVQQTHTPPHTWGMMASVCGLWRQCGQLETTQAVTLKSGSSMTLLQFLNLPGFGGNCIRSSAISPWGCGQGVLACLLGCL